MIGTTSCTKRYTTLPDQIEEIQLQVTDINTHIPEEFLIKCEWLAPLEGNTQSRLLETNIKIVDTFTECYLRHNSFVDWFNNTKGKQ